MVSGGSMVVSFQAREGTPTNCTYMLGLPDKMSLLDKLGVHNKLVYIVAVVFCHLFVYSTIELECKPLSYYEPDIP